VAALINELGFGFWFLVFDVGAGFEQGLKGTGCEVSLTHQSSLAAQQADDAQASLQSVLCMVHRVCRKGAVGSYCFSSM
jgi:hypothetical protein